MKKDVAVERVGELASLFLSVLALAGCGGGGAGETPQSTPATSAPAPAASAPAPAASAPAPAASAPAPAASAPAPAASAPAPAASAPPPAASAAEPSYAPVSQLTGSALPGLQSITFKGAATTGSAGFMEPEAPTALALTVQTNGLGGSGTHQIGFGLASASDPIRNEPYAVPVEIQGATRNPKTLGGVAAERYYSFLPTSRWQVEHVLTGPRTNYATFGLWSTVQGFIPGYFSGSPSWLGGYVYGSPTVPEELNALNSKAFTGLAGAHWLFPYKDTLKSKYGPITVNFDASRRVATISLTLTHSNEFIYVYPPGAHLVEFDDLFSSAPAVASDPLTCEADVDLTTGSFLCSLPSSGGEIRGRFYGPRGDEVAGVFSRWVTSGSGTNWGVTGGFIAKASSAQ